jgi:hypothetical protein
MAPSIHTQVPALRIRPANSRPVGANGARVIYWMIASRRVRFNFALQRAADWSRDLGLPLVILEALRSDYPWASDRLHRFVADGMADTSAALEGRNVAYIPCRDPEPREADPAVASIRDPHRGPDHDGGGYPHRLSNPLAGNPLALADRDRGLGTEPSFCRPSIPGTVSTTRRSGARLRTDSSSPGTWSGSSPTGTRFSAETSGHDQSLNVYIISKKICSEF